MVESNWAELGGKEVRYRDRTWTLTGAVGVRERGELLAVEARQADDVRGRTATLYFGIDDAPDSLNPGSLGDHFDSLERSGSRQRLVVKTAGRTYRYDLQRLDYE
jgi:hypothetical protein